MKLYKDAQNALYLYKNGYLDTLDNRRKQTIINGSLLKRLTIIFINVVKEFNLLFSNPTKLEIADKVVCMVNSENNFNSLIFLNSKNMVFIKATVLGKPIDNAKQVIFKSKFYYSLLFFLLLPYTLLFRINRQNLILLHKAFGLQAMFKGKFSKNKPQKVIFANDHIPEMRAYILACKELGIETFYIQHGSVSKYFPPLIFSHALLESEYSAATYQNIKPVKNGVIKLIGIPKLDAAIRFNRTRDKIEIIGLAINQNDDFLIVNKLINELISFAYKVLLRKHPADNRDFNSQLLVEDGNKINVLEFVQKCDFLIASDSSIHVEANSLKCRSLYYQMHTNKKKYDYYGFVKNGYVDEAFDTHGIVEYLKRFDYAKADFTTNKYQFYNSTIGTIYYGKSSELAKKYIYEGVDY
ncbi:MAG: hypothetical protein ABI594_08045 [Ginsengibacter sp.]